MNKMDILNPSATSDPDVPVPRIRPFSPAPELDSDDYQADIADFGLAQEQEAEFLQTLWSIMGHFARLGFSVDVCGLIFAEFNEASASAAGDDSLVPSTNMESASEPKEAAHE